MLSLHVRDFYKPTFLFNIFIGMMVFATSFVMPKEFNCSHPFIYYLNDSKINTTIFSGRLRQFEF